MTYIVSAAYSMASDLLNRHPEMVRISQGHGWRREAITLRHDGRLYELARLHHDGDGGTGFAMDALDGSGIHEAFGPELPNVQPCAEYTDAIYHGTPEEN